MKLVCRRKQQRIALSSEGGDAISLQPIPEEVTFQDTVSGCFLSNLTDPHWSKSKRSTRVILLDPLGGQL